MSRRIILLSVVAGCSTPGAGTPPPRTAEVKEKSLTSAEAVAALWPDESRVALAPTTVREREAIAWWVPRLLAGVTPDEPTVLGGGPALAGAGLTLELWQVDGHPFWVLRERPGSRRGAGAYLFRAAPARGRVLILQAPHAYYDIDTGPIAARLFFAGTGQALFTNTLHRFRPVPGPTKRVARSPADVAHAPSHLFAAATAAAAGAGPVTVVQLHGFADREVAAQVIVSAGDARASTPAARSVARELTGVLPDVALYPDQIRVLGGTKNVQKRALGADDEFLHLEISRTARRTLLREPDALRALRDALGGVVR